MDHHAETERRISNEPDVAARASLVLALVALALYQFTTSVPSNAEPGMIHLGTPVAWIAAVLLVLAVAVALATPGPHVSVLRPVLNTLAGVAVVATLAAAHQQITLTVEAVSWYSRPTSHDPATGTTIALAMVSVVCLAAITIVAATTRGSPVWSRAACVIAAMTPGTVVTGVMVSRACAWDTRPTGGAVLTGAGALLAGVVVAAAALSDRLPVWLSTILRWLSWAAVVTGGAAFVSFLGPNDQGSSAWADALEMMRWIARVLAVAGTTAAALGFTIVTVARPRHLDARAL